MVWDEVQNKFEMATKMNASVFDKYKQFKAGLGDKLEEDKIRACKSD
jgi:hypothetical protein